MKNKIKLGVFCPSSFDNYPFFKEILDKKKEEIDLLISNASGHNLVEKYAHENCMPYLSYPIGKLCNVLISNDQIIRVSDRIVIFENGESKNNETVKRKCEAVEKSYKEIKIPVEILSRDICLGINDIYQEFKKTEKEDFGEWLTEHKRAQNNLIKLIEKIK